MDFLGNFKPLELLNFLVKEHNYIHLEGTTLSENEAYLIHPANWPKSDIESARKCWTAMEKAGLQFVGVNAPETVNGHTPKHFDGYLNGMACELKFMNSNTVNFKKNVINKIDEAANQGAEIIVIILSEEISMSDDEIQNLEKTAIKRINQRKHDPLFSKKQCTLKKAVVIKK